MSTPCDDDDDDDDNKANIDDEDDDVFECQGLLWNHFLKQLFV